MTKKDPYKDSPYDYHGMPYGCEKIDYSKPADVAKHTVKQKDKKPPRNLNDIDYVPPGHSKESRGLDKDGNPRKPHFNSSIEDGVGFPEKIEKVDIEDPGVRRELIVEEAEDKGFKETDELPKVAKEEDVKAVKDKKEDDDQNDFLNKLRASGNKKDEK